MEWSKSTLSAAELERRRQEYIDAALNMSRRASIAPAPEKPPEPAEYLVPEPVIEPPPEPVEEPEETCAAEEAAEPEEMHEPEEICCEEPKPEKKTFGVFDMQELTEAVRNGEMDGDKLREATEILAEMSGKTKEMQELAGRTEKKETSPRRTQTQTAGRRTQQRSGGSCPRRTGQSAASKGGSGNGR